MPYLSNPFCIYLWGLWRNTKWATKINRLFNHTGGKSNSWLITYPVKSAYLSSRISISRPQLPLTLFAFSQWVCCKTILSDLLPSSSCQQTLLCKSLKWLFSPQVSPSHVLSNSPFLTQIPQSLFLSNIGYFNKRLWRLLLASGHFSSIFLTQWPIVRTEESMKLLWSCCNEELQHLTKVLFKTSWSCSKGLSWEWALFNWVKS